MRKNPSSRADLRLPKIIKKKALAPAPARYPAGYPAGGMEPQTYPEAANLSPLGSLGSHEPPPGTLGTAMGPKGTPVP